MQLLRIGKRFEQRQTGVYLELWPYVLSFCGRGWFKKDRLTAEEQLLSKKREEMGWGARITDEDIEDFHQFKLSDGETSGSNSSSTLNSGNVSEEEDMDVKCSSTSSDVKMSPEMMSSTLLPLPPPPTKMDTSSAGNITNPPEVRRNLRNDFNDAAGSTLDQQQR